MIPYSATIATTAQPDELQQLSWQQQLSSAPLSAESLLAQLNMPAHLLPHAHAGAQQFPIRAPFAYLQKIEKGNPDDPLFKQIWPFSSEGESSPDGYSLDPLGEAEANAVPGIVHKYHGRVLLIVNGSCAIHCRYCFRRHFPYSDNTLSTAQWKQALTYIEQDTSINEVILSGGDPLSSNDKRLFLLMEQIEKIEHVTRLRIHSRLPVVLPDRITPALCERLKQSRLNVVMVIHSNHVQELGPDVAQAMTRLRHAGIHLLNQTVLLRGINDHSHKLAELSEGLFDMGVLPYYLHLLDEVVGAHHYQVSLSEGQAIMAELQARLPGFLVPKLVKEVAGEPHKILIDAQKTPF
ncbi:EF-P beta-lysylation protein EpmB [Bermanella sp. R86510]|uniref:EF-P beta-lysylation protein EpmB n=1 Tax=unclassified Bermanella TaxID=2627862 RepID=UPI0037CC130F